MSRPLPTLPPAARAACVLLAAIALTVVFTWPLASDPGAIGRLDTSDGRFSIWNVAWVAHAILDDRAHLFDANIFHPHRGTLAYSEANLVAGLLAVPAYALTHNALLAHNTVVLISFVLSFVCMYALARRLGAGGTGSSVAAIGFAFSPVTMARTAHIQLLMTATLPAAMLAFHAFVERPAWRRGLALGVVLGVAALACGYYGIFAGLFVGWTGLVYGTSASRRTDVRYWGGLALAAIVSTALVSPAFSHFEALRDEGFRAAVNVDEAQRFSADWRAYLASAAYAHAWLLRLIGHWPEVLFPGFVMVVLGVGGAVITARRSAVLAAAYGLGAVLAAWASFGPSAGLFPLLARVFPFLTYVRAPARFGFLVLLAVCVFAAFAADALVRRWPSHLLPMALVLALGADISAMPLPFVRPPRIPLAYEMLGTLDGGAVVEFPFPYKRFDYHHHTIAMYNSTAHWHPLVNGYSDYIPSDFDALAAKVNDFPDPGSFELLRARGVRYVVWRMMEYVPAGREEIARRIARYSRELAPVTKTDGIWLYEIVQWPTPSPSTTP